MRSPWPAGRPFGAGGAPSGTVALARITATRVEGRRWSLLLFFIDAQSGGTSVTPPPIEPANIVLRTVKGELDTRLRVTGVATSPVNPFPVEIVDERVLLAPGEGDFPAFTLQLTGIAADLLDPRRAQAGFVLAYPRDPAQAPAALAAPPEPTMPRGPVVDYLARDYAAMRSMMIAELQTLLPGWRADAADLLTAVVEILAYAGDELSYYQDAVGTEAYLGTARKRVSMRRHARLVDYVLNEGCNARAWVAIGAATTSFLLPAGTPLITAPSTGMGVSGAIAPASLNALAEAGAIVFETMQDLNVVSALSGNLQLYAPANATRALLARGSTSAALVGSPALEPGMLMLLQELLSPATGLSIDADPAHRHVVRVVFVDSSGPASASDPTLITPFRWSAADALPFDLWLTRTIEGNTVTGISAATGNIVLADHGATMSGIALEPPFAPLNGRWSPALPPGNLTWAAPPPDANGPAALALLQDADVARPQVSLADAGRNAVWTAALDLFESGPLARKFVVETETAEATTLRFGEGVNGRMPAPGTKLTATYRIGNGMAGNIGANALVAAVTSLPVTSVSNPLPAYGGTDPEPLEHARLYAPYAYRRQERAVTAADYRDIAERFPGVQKANAWIEPSGRNFVATVAIDRAGGFTDPPFLAAVASFLEPYRTIGASVVVIPPVYVPLEIVLVAFPAAGTPPNAVRSALQNAFSTSGFFNPDRFTFGQPVYLSDVIAAALRVPGVAWINSDAQTDPRIRFQRWREAPGGELEAGEIPMRPVEIARADSNPSQPQFGRVDFLVVTGA